MDGWARRYIVVTPDGVVLPCHQAHTHRPASRSRTSATRPLGEIWSDSPALRAFRGEAWMPEPCRTCERAAHGLRRLPLPGVRLTGDAAATDPACALSPRHQLIETARAATADPPAELVFRSPRRPARA